jgi:hypothetical protein
MDLVSILVASPELRQQMTGLVEQKRASRELDSTPRIAELEEYMESLLGEIEAMTIDGSTVDGTMDDLNEYFRTSLRVLWQDPFN